MLDVALHNGIEHPNLLWIVIASILSFIAGLFLNARADAKEEKPNGTTEPSE